ncbi:uncharacterized protein [Parasteatoda tepidariorum]|uniref:uncharacterized protein n=1 Tax=Parasteatoda tepidariorum TaxID=114398 RepID=UPI00077FE44C|nr:uncharacterized protein LOC107440651 [Parasteatoda tepidariorum]
MDFNWFFRNGRYRSDQPNFFSEENDIGDSPHEEGINSSDVPFMEPFGNMDDTARGLFQHMEDMLNNMFSSSFVPFGSIKLEESTPNDPRSMMLKDPDCKRSEENHDVKFSDVIIPDHFTDSDIDEHVARHGLILDDNKSERQTPKLFSYKKFSSIRTVHLPDGTVEEHRKCTDSQGNVTTTIRRSIGDQSYEVTTHADNQGIKEKEENLTNLDESEISDFEQRWLNMKNRKLPIQEPRSDLVLPKSAPAGDPSYLSIFKKFFGL